ncbi:BTB/POZ protein [Rhizophagus irregularis DAOM 181602=DAOM 197198]|nr:BTB/POZ protein [Rhizophagus irregularis DAOM 181602=DAOM 197198]
MAVHIKLPNISPEIFQIILKYIYGGKLSLEEFDASYVVKILVAASELNLQELIPYTQSFLINNQADWIEQNFIPISRDGLTSEKFHNICDNQSNTVTVIKVRGSNEILGGYNPIKWKSGGFGITNDSFIFSLMNNENNEDYLLSRVKDKKYAINYSKKLGPSFGKSDLTLSEVIMISGGDLVQKFDRCHCKKSSYEKPIRKTEDKFFIEEYEIFQINI